MAQALLVGTGICIITATPLITAGTTVGATEVAMGDLIRAPSGAGGLAPVASSALRRKTLTARGSVTRRIVGSGQGDRQCSTGGHSGLDSGF
jgi:hypothetical protein